MLLLLLHTAEASLKRYQTASGGTSGGVSPSKSHPSGPLHSSQHLAAALQAAARPAAALGHLSAAPRHSAAASGHSHLQTQQLAAALEMPLEGSIPQAATTAASHHTVDPIEAPAPAWALDPTHASPPLPQAASTHQPESSSSGPPSVLPWATPPNLSPVRTFSGAKPVEAAGNVHSLHGSSAAFSAMQGQSPLRPEAPSQSEAALRSEAANRSGSKAESAMESWAEAGVTALSTRPASRESQPATAGSAQEWHGFADDEDTEVAATDAAGCMGQLETAPAQAVGSNTSTHHRADAVVCAPRLSEEQQISVGFSGFGVIEGKQMPDLTQLLTNDEVTGSLQAAARTSSAIFSRGPSQDVPSGTDLTGRSGTDRGDRRSSRQQRAPPSVPLPQHVSRQVSGALDTLLQGPCHCDAVQWRQCGLLTKLC